MEFKTFVQSLNTGEFSYLYSINGLHEIHITVDTDQVAQLKLYCRKYKIKPIFAVSTEGGDSNQLMISKYKNGTSLDCIEKCFELANSMKEFGLKIKRRKVEAMMNIDGGPKGSQLPLDNCSLTLKGYWEFHIKVPVDSISEIETLDSICKKHYAYISYNCFSKDFEPLVTLRLYNTSYNDSLELKAKLIEDIQEKNYKCNYGIKQELAVYDDNQNLDSVWMKI